VELRVNSNRILNLKQNDKANEGSTYLGVPAGESVSVGIPFMLYGLYAFVENTIILWGLI